jgi:hypothetical protein
MFMGERYIVDMPHRIIAGKSLDRLENMLDSVRLDGKPGPSRDAVESILSVAQYRLYGVYYNGSGTSPVVVDTRTDLEKIGERYRLTKELIDEAFKNSPQDAKETDGRTYFRILETTLKRKLPLVCVIRELAKD